MSLRTQHHIGRPLRGLLLTAILPLSTVHAEPAQAASAEVLDLDPFVVTGTRTSQRLSEVPVRTELLTVDEIKLHTPRTLADVVEFVTGVRVENNCQNCNFSQIRLLGLEGAYSQILVDGQPMVSSVAAVYAVEQIPAALIDRVEVVKGGGSALYGPGSIGGVVNLISRTPTTTGGHAQFVLSSMKGTNVSSKSPDIGFSAGVQGDFVWNAQRDAMVVWVQRDRELPVDLTDDGYSEIGYKELTAAGLRYKHTFTGIQAAITLDYSHTYEDRRGGNHLELPPHEADVAEATKTTRDALSVNWDHTLSENFDYRLTVAGAKTDRDSYYGAGRDPNAYGNSENPLYIYDAQFNHHLASHLLSWGGQFHEETLEDTQPAYSRQTDATYRNTGVFVQDQWKFAPDWELVAGARYDHNNQIEDNVTSPRASLRWSATEIMTLRAGYSTGFRAPQVFDEDLHITQVAGGGQIIKNAPDLAEESARSFTFGSEWSWIAGGATWMAEANVFHTRVTDSFVLEEDTAQSTANESVLVRRNGSGSKIYGAEINIGAAWGDAFRIQLGYVEQRSRYDEAIAPLEGTSTTRIQRTPDRYGILSIDSALPVWALRLFVGTKYTGPMEVPHAAPDPADIPSDYPFAYVSENLIETSPSFLVFDINLSRTFEFASASGRHRDLVVRLGVKNLTDDRQKDFDQGEFRDSGYVYGPRFPRTFFLSTELDF